MNMTKKLLIISFFILPFTFINASSAECIDVLMNVLNINKSLTFSDGKYYKLEYTHTLKYINPKSKTKQTINDKCTIVFNKDKIYFKNKDTEYLKTKTNVVCIDHTERVIFISDGVYQDIGKTEQFNKFLADSLIRNCKVEFCHKVNANNNLYSITLIPDKKRQLTMRGVNKINYVYDISTMALKEYHASYNTTSSVESVDYVFLNWYIPVDGKTIVDLVALLKNNKLSTRYPNYRILLNPKK